MWHERARDFLAMQGTGDAAILAGAGMMALALSFALPAREQANPGSADPTAVVVSLPQRPPPPAAGWQPSDSISVPGHIGSLTGRLQTELKRVGCYEGEIDGVWRKPTRLAMKAFTDRVNARLPVDKPDHILLALLQGHQGRACALACGERQSPQDADRCGAETPADRVVDEPAPAVPPPPQLASGPNLVPVPVPVPAIRPPPQAPLAAEPRLAAPPRLVKDTAPARLVPEPPAPVPAERDKHAAGDRTQAPAAGVRGGRPRGYVRGTYSQIRYARSVFRSLKRAATALPFP
jgi:hypothetical protein